MEVVVDDWLRIVEFSALLYIPVHIKLCMSAPMRACAHICVHTS